METDNVVFIESGSKPPGTDIKQILKEDNAIAVSIIKRYEITPSKKIKQVVDITYDKLVEFLSRSGIEIKKEDIPSPIFLDWTSIKPLNHDLAETGYRSEIDTLGGEYSPLRGGRPLIILNPINNNLHSIAGCVFHEAYHAIGKKIFTVDYRPIPFITPRRSGLTVGKNMKEECNQGTSILEEAICAYDTARCIEEISSHPLLAGIVQMKDELVKNMGVDNKGKISLPGGKKIMVKYCNFNKPGIYFRKGYFWRQKYATLSDLGKPGISGMLLEKILSRFPPEKKEDFLLLLRKARMDYRLIKDVAHKLEEVWGRETYARILETEYEEEDLWKLYDELENKKSET